MGEKGGGAGGSPCTEGGRPDSGAPHVALRGRAGLLAGAQGVGSWQLSLSHTSHNAIAVVLALAPADQ